MPAPSPNEGRVFVRPDSPLKPFSGRIVELEGLTLAHFDHGFYYDDAQLPVIVSPVRDIVEEWRFVVIAGQVRTGSGYQADGRTPMAAEQLPLETAQEIVSNSEFDQPAFILDLCRSGDQVAVLELNPFSGADFYDSDPAAIVAGVEELLRD